jgi:alkanesulfonate monooxygenase SsuD/methylene tetrahydromethanopterin reductase-like flavin-dependent oxidoreductase (luciferase family)
MFWVTNPQNEYPGAPGQPNWPDYFKGAMNRLTVLTVAAAHTAKVELGTSILVFGNYDPVSLARRAASIDVVSNSICTSQ